MATELEELIQFLSSPSPQVSFFVQHSTILYLFRCRWRIFRQTFSVKSISWSDAAYTASILIKIHDFIASISIYILLLCFTWLGLGDSFHASSVRDTYIPHLWQFFFLFTESWLWEVSLYGAGIPCLLLLIANLVSLWWPLGFRILHTIVRLPFSGCVVEESGHRHCSRFNWVWGWAAVSCQVSRRPAAIISSTLERTKGGV